MKVSEFILASLFLTSHVHGDAFETEADYFGGVDNDVYMDWIRATNASSRYENSIFLDSKSDSSQGAAVHWTIQEDTLHLAVACRATGWIGFGISEIGGMKGSDVALFTAESPEELVDAYILDDRIPNADDCQNWNLIDSHTDSGEFLIFEATRPLDTGDAQDHRIIDDGDSSTIPPTRVIAAWGDSGQVGYHGLGSARGSIRWFSDGKNDLAIFKQKMAENADAFFEVRAKDYPIKPQVTEYKKICSSWDDLLTNKGVPDIEGLTIIGLEPIVDEDVERHVHHFTLTGSFETKNGNDCSNFEDELEMVYAWTPGEGPFLLPNNVGLPLGEGSFRSFKLEIHYDNPEQKVGMLDSSGMRIYYNNKPREHEMGMMITGDQFVKLRDQPVGNGVVEHSFSCPSSCSNIVLDQPVTVLREALHMHKSGIKMVNEQIRDNKVIHKGTVEYFDFDQQGNPPVQQKPFQILPGDSFQTTCTYKSDSDEQWGFASNDEMCMTFISYYPRRTIAGKFAWSCSYEFPFKQCASEHTARSLNTATDVLREFGASGGECGTKKTTLPVIDEKSISRDSGAMMALLGTVAIQALVMFFILA